MRARFGPAGNDEFFYAQNHTSTVEMPAWISEMGLDAFEYSFGRGVRLGAKTAMEIASAAKPYDIALSVHAPYFINLAVSDEEHINKNWRYFLDSATAAAPLGADRLIFHPGGAKGMERQEALAKAKALLLDILGRLDSEGFSALTLCPETLGKVNQLGDLDEVISLCEAHERLIPCIDFAHLHARDLGAMNSREDFARVLDRLEATLGKARVRAMHVHFSHIEYTKGGEKQHRTFAEEGYGPDFEPLAAEFIRRAYTPRVICESKGSMAIDAATMKRVYDKLLLESAGENANG